MDLVFSRELQLRLKKQDATEIPSLYSQFFLLNNAEFQTFFIGLKGRVLELLSPLCATSAYSITANALGLEYDSLICQDPDVPSS